MSTRHSFVDVACVDLFLKIYNNTVELPVIYYLIKIHTSSTGMGAGENGNNHWKWE